MNCVALLLALVACGRLHFDPLSGDGGDVGDVAVDAGPAFHAETYLKASNTRLDGRFGVGDAISADGTTVVIGSDGETSNATTVDGDQSNQSLSYAGAAYVFVRAGSTWQQQAYLKPPDPATNAFFGQPIAIAADGNTVAISASDAAGNEGRGYVFTRAGASWSFEAELSASNADVNDTFSPMALSGDGNTLVATSFLEASNATGIDGNQSDNSAAGAGAAYVFVRTGSVWTQQAYIKASNTAPSAAFGSSAALSQDGSTLAIGAGGEASAAIGIGGDQANTSAPGAGAVYVFTRAGSVWTQQAYIKASNTDAGDAFGITALSANGDVLAVGAASEASAATGVDGDQSDNSVPGAGALYVFARAGATWSQSSYLKAPISAMNEGFGWPSLSADGTVLAVGAEFDASAAVGIGGDETDTSVPEAGAVFVYARSGATWAQRAYLKAATPTPSRFGERCMISGDGSIVVAGAFRDQNDASGIDSPSTDGMLLSEAGAAYIIE